MRFLKFVFVIALFAALNAPVLAVSAVAPEDATNIESSALLVYAPAQADADSTLPAPVVEKLEQLHVIAKNRSLRQLNRFVDAESNFSTNPNARSRKRYWDLMRRVGVDRTAQLETVLDQSYRSTTLDQERFFVWPRYAALTPSELKTLMHTPYERRLLEEMIGENGMQQARNDGTYVGPSLTISEAGEIRAFLLTSAEPTSPSADDAMVR